MNNINSKLNHMIGILLLIASANLSALSERVDVDLDNDGLIEIFDVDDFLAIPGVLHEGIDTNLYGMTSGCPEGGCTGFELMNDLDLSELPYRQYANRFFVGQIFEGNNHSLVGFSAESSIDTRMALFYRIANTVIRNLKIVDVRLQVDDAYLGSLANIAENSLIINVEASGHLTNDHFSAGLVTIADNTSFVNCRFQGILDPGKGKGFAKMGGLVTFGENVSIYSSSAKVTMPSTAIPADVGGLIVGTASETPVKSRIKASFAEWTYSYDTKALELYTRESRDNPIIIDSYLIKRKTKHLRGKVKYYNDQPGSNSELLSLEALQSAEQKCILNDGKDNCDVFKHTNGWSSHVDQGFNQVWNLEYNTLVPSINSKLLFDSDGWLETCEDTCEDGVNYLLANNLVPEKMNDVAGSLRYSLVVLMFALYFVLFLSRRRESF